MLLQKLREYSQRMAFPPRLYSELPVRYIVELDESGALLSKDLIDTADPTSREAKRGKRMLTPSVQRAVGIKIKPLLLTDRADYALGYVAEAARPERVAQCHASFIELARRCADATGEPSVGAIVRFLDGDPPGQIRFEERFDPGAAVAFRVNGVVPTDLPAVQQFWPEENERAAAGAPTMQCIVCGRDRPAMERLELKLKGVPAGHTSGTSIISFNQHAFESYGLSASLNAPTCSDCGERFTKAANELLASDQSRVRLDNVAYIFWTREARSDVPFAALLNEADPEQLKALYESAFSGAAGATVLEEDRFYAAALSGSGGRAAVRDWIDTSVAEAKRHLARWFQMQRIIQWSETAAK